MGGGKARPTGWRLPNSHNLTCTLERRKRQGQPTTGKHAHALTGSLMVAASCTAWLTVWLIVWLTASHAASLTVWLIDGCCLLHCLTGLVYSLAWGDRQAR